MLYAGAAIQTPSGLSLALDRVRAGDFQGALAAAEAEPDPLRRAEASLYVRHQAGDLDGALAIGLHGAEMAPRNEWLLDRTAFVALSLRRPGPARVSLDALRRALDADPQASESARAALAGYEIEEKDMLDRLAERDAALTRARWTA